MEPTMRMPLPPPPPPPLRRRLNRARRVAAGTPDSKPGLLDGTNALCLLRLSAFCEEGRQLVVGEFFLAQVKRIADTIDGESEKVRLAMGAALMGIGKRSASLNKAALKVAQDVGPIEFTSASGKCEPFDVVKHLTTDRLKEKLGT